MIGFTKNSDMKSIAGYLYESRAWIPNVNKNHIRFDCLNNSQCHLKIRLPEPLLAGEQYYIKMCIKAKTDNGFFRIFAENNKGDTNLIFNVTCNEKNEFLINGVVGIKDESQYISFTSTDFLGGWIETEEVNIEKINKRVQIADNSLEICMFYIGLYAECSQGIGGLWSYFDDIGITELSVFYEHKELMKMIHGIAWESGIHIVSDISEAEKMSCKLGYSTYTTRTLDEVVQDKKMNKQIPVLNFSWKINHKLNNISDNIFQFKEIYDYAVLKNCIIQPVFNSIKNKNIKVPIVVINFPAIKDIKSKSEYEERLLHGERSIVKYEFDDKYKQKILKTNGPFWYGTGKKLRYIDNTEENCTVFSGIRHTADIPDNYVNNIWFVGYSVSSGAGHVIDEHTIESFLQKIINKDMEGQYRVNNVLMPCGYHYGNYASAIDKLPIADGDIIILSSAYTYILNNSRFMTDSISDMIYYLDLIDKFQRPHDFGEVFCDSCHMKPNGYKKVAEFIYEYLLSINLGKEKKGSKLNIGSQNEELARYCKSISKYRKEGLNGCIVMNCNPFTLGHRYLIEQAAKQVDNLYIFVVEEDKSEFKFADRFMLVKKGTEDISNATVIASGKFIISTLTFKAYFEKGKKQDVVIDTTQDLDIFGRYIAPTLNISIRFAGEEPLDMVTKQYNQNMRLMLPKYGISFVEVPRKQAGNEVISASRVRKLIKEGNLNELVNLVPITTLEYIQHRFK